LNPLVLFAEIEAISKGSFTLTLSVLIDYNLLELGSKTAAG
jgi:hypothetical protein